MLAEGCWGGFRHIWGEGETAGTPRLRRELVAVAVKGEVDPPSARGT
jgi:hypothetical protein